MARVVFDQAGLKELFDGPHSAVGKELKRRGLRISRGAKKLCPVDTGRLRASIAEELSQDGTLLIERIGTDVEYGKYQELGTVNMRARPFLRPALAAEAGVAVNL